MFLYSINVYSRYEIMPILKQLLFTACGISDETIMHNTWHLVMELLSFKLLRRSTYLNTLTNFIF